MDIKVFFTFSVFTAVVFLISGCTHERATPTEPSFASFTVEPNYFCMNPAGITQIRVKYSVDPGGVSESAFHNYVTRISTDPNVVAAPAGQVGLTFSQTFDDGLSGEWNFTVNAPLPSEWVVVGKLTPIASDNPLYQEKKKTITVTGACPDPGDIDSTGN